MVMAEWGWERGRASSVRGAFRGTRLWSDAPEELHRRAAAQGETDLEAVRLARRHVQRRLQAEQQQGVCAGGQQALRPGQLGRHAQLWRCAEGPARTGEVGQGPREATSASDRAALLR